MSLAGRPQEHELIVAEDGSIPADQLARLGVQPGAHLRVLADLPSAAHGSIAGRLSSWPELTWKDFERASDLAGSDLNHS